MISPEAGTLTAGDITFLGDHVHPARFYYYPTVPHLAIDSDGRPEFSLTLYRRLEPQEAGGYLVLSVDLSTSQTALQAAWSQVQRLVEANLQAVLEPLLYLHGNVVLSAPLIVAPTATPMPTLTAPLVAGTDAGIIQMQPDSSWGDLDPAGIEGIRAFLAECLSARYFDLRYAYTIPPAVAPVFAWRAERPAEVESEIDLNVHAVERHVYGQTGLADLLAASGRHVDAFIHLVDMDDSADSPVQVHVNCPRVGSIVEWLHVDLEYGPPGAAQKRTVMLHYADDRPAVKWLMDPNLGHRYHYSYYGTFNPNAFRARSYEFASSSFEADDAVLVIDIPAFLLSVEIVPVQFESLKRVELTLGYDDDANALRYRQSLVLERPQEHEVWRVLLSDPKHKEYWYENFYYIVFYNAITYPRRTNTSDFLILVNPRGNAQHTLSVISDASSQVAGYQIQVEALDQLTGIRETQTVCLRGDSANEQKVSFHWPLLNDVVMRYRVTILYPDGSRQQGEF